MLTEFTSENQFFNKQEIENASKKLMRLCGSVENIKSLLSAYAIKDVKQPIHDLVISFELPNKEWKGEIWFDLCMKEKKALKLLSRADNIEAALGNAPSSYDNGMSVLRTISYTHAKEIESIKQSGLKEALYNYTELCIEHSISEDAYETGLDILTNHKLKNKDNLPDIVIDGKTLGEEFSRYYMTKLPIGDIRGLMLGKLTNCCQSIGDHGRSAAIDGMTNENGGFYVIFEKSKSGKIDIANDRMIAQSYSWLGIDGAKGKSLVFDSWERLGIDNNKLLDPFYSRFADIAKTQGITKVTIGTGGNTPEGNYIPLSRDSQPTKFNGIAPYNDAKNQYVILDINYDDKEKHISPYDENTRKNRLNILFIRLASDGDIESLKLLLDKESEHILSEAKGEALTSAERNGRIEIVELLLDKESEHISNEAKDVALTSAATYGEVEIVKLLLDKESKNISNEAKGEALIYALEYNRTEMLELLLEKDPNKILSEAFIYAAVHHKIEMVKLLLNNEDYKISEEAISKAFEKAVFYENKEIVELLLEEKNYSIPKKGIFNGFKNTVIYQRLGLLELFFNKFDILPEEQNKLFIHAIQNLDNKVSKFLINKCKDNLTSESIQKAFSSDHIKNDQDMYKHLVEHVPHSVIESVNFDNENDKNDFIKNVARAEMEQSLNKAANSDIQKTNPVSNFQKMSK